MNKIKFELKTIEELCKVKPQSGGTPLSSKQEYYEGGEIPWVITADITKEGKYISNTEKKITELGFKESNVKMFPVGTLLFSMYGSVGKMSITKIELCTNQAILGLTPNEDIISVDYMYYILQINVSKLVNMARGGTQANINAKMVKEFKIPIPYKDNKPDLETQKRIVEKLELAESLKTKRKEAQELTKEYLNSVFLEMFGDPRTNPKGFEVNKLDKISNITMGQSPSGNSYNSNDKGTPFFQGKAEFSDKYTITKKWTTEPTKLALKNDILMSVRAPVGTVNLSSVDCCIGRGLASIRPNQNKIKLNFLFNFFRLNESYIESLGEGSTFKAITSKQLRNLQIPTPPIELQNKFAQIVEQVESLEKLQSKSSIEIDNLYNKSMQQAFKGEI